MLEGHREPRTNSRYERLAKRFTTMVKELRRKGGTLQLLWEEYLRKHPDGYQYSQFCYHFHRWRQSGEVVIMPARVRLLRCAPPAEVSCRIDGVECGRWSFRSERVAGAERWNGGTVAG